MESLPILDVSDVTLRFGGVTALEEANFSVKSGELFAIIGPNGAGKTSIFNCINGVYKPQNGSILFDGGELIGKSPVAVARKGGGVCGVGRRGADQDHVWRGGAEVHRGRRCA